MTGGRQYWRGSFALSITPAGAALRKMVGARTQLEGIGALVGTSAPLCICASQAASQCLGTPFKVTLASSALHSIKSTGDSSYGLEKGRSWLKHTGPRVAMAESHCLYVRELGCPLLPSSFLPFSLLELGTMGWAQGWDF